MKTPERTISHTAAGQLAFVPAAPRIEGLLPLLEDEDGIPRLPRALQNQPVRMLVDAWSWYDSDYQAQIETGNLLPQIVFTMLRNGEPIGLPRVMAMAPDAASMFPVTLEVPAQVPPQEGVFSYQFAYFIRSAEESNAVTSDAAGVRHDRTAPNGWEQIMISGPALIDRAHLDANGGRARFELPQWGDIKLEDEVLLFAQPFDDVTLPLTPILTSRVTPAELEQASLALLIDEAMLVNGRYRVSCHLQDRSGNVNRFSQVLDVTVDLDAQVQPLLPIETLTPYVSIFGWINCQSLEQVRLDAAANPPPAVAGLKFRVPLPQEGVQVGDRVELAWQVSWDRFGEDPIAAIVHLPAVPLPATGELLMPQINTLLLEAMDRVVVLKQERIELLRRLHAAGNLTEAELILNAGKLGLALDKLRVLVAQTGTTQPPMEGSVQVGYRVSAAAGRRLSAKPLSVFSSLQKPGGAWCNNRLSAWLKQ